MAKFSPLPTPTVPEGCSAGERINDRRQSFIGRQSRSFVQTHPGHRFLRDLSTNGAEKRPRRPRGAIYRGEVKSAAALDRAAIIHLAPGIRPGRSKNLRARGSPEARSAGPQRRPLIRGPSSFMARRILGHDRIDGSQGGDRDRGRDNERSHGDVSTSILDKRTRLPDRGGMCVVP